jgi:hypothetical protein
MHELVSAFHPEKTALELHKEVKILNPIEYQTDKNLATLIKKLHKAPVEWGKLKESFIEGKNFKASDKELPGIFLEMHIDGIVKELAANNKNFVSDPIPDGFSTDHYVFKKNKGLGQTIVRPQGINGTSLTYCEYDNLLVATNENGNKYLIVIEAKSGTLGDAATEEYRNKLFEPLKEFCQTIPESGISSLGYILITTNKQKTTNLIERKSASVKYNYIGTLVCISESHYKFVQDALDTGKRIRGVPEKKDKSPTGKNQASWPARPNIRPTI